MKRVPSFDFVLQLALFGAVGLLVGCDHEHGADDQAHEATLDQHGGAHDELAGEHGHEHAEDAIGITRWTDSLELFAEHPPAVAGQPLPFLAHLTRLEGFLPLQRATVTLVLEGPDRVEATVTEMLRPGIFRPTPTAPRPGTYRAELRVAGPEVEDRIEGFSIEVYPTAEAARQGAGAEEEAGPEPISFLKEQQWQIPFATAFAMRGRLVPAVEVSGEVTTPPSGRAEVGAAIAGRVVPPPSGLPRPGQAVRRGELLATLAPAPAAPEAAARADLAVVEAEVRVQAAEAAAARAERLLADRAIAQREIDEAHRELRVAGESLDAARRARDVFAGAASGRGAGTYRVTAPIDGVIVDVEATAGATVTSGEPLFHVVDLSELWIRARVPEQEATRLRSDEDAAFELAGMDAWLPLRVTGDAPTASVVSVGRTVLADSRTVEVFYALLAPDPRLRVGAMVRVAVPSGDPWEGVIVPLDAVLEDEGRSVVFVQVEGEAFEERTVRLGPRSGPRVGIAQGVEADERVVTTGANVIRLSARASSTPSHGHVH